MAEPFLSGRILSMHSRAVVPRGAFRGVTYGVIPEDQPAPEWVAQYLNAPPAPLPPGTYCRNCSHPEPEYFDRMVPGRRGEGVPCCDRKDCGCAAHMVEVVVVP